MLCPVFIMLLTLTYTQRRFAFEHPQLLDRVADDDDDNDDAADGHSCASTQPEAPESEEGSQPSSTMSSISQRGKRCKNNPLPAPVPAPKGADFWSMVNKWFAARTQPDQLGVSWTTPGWIK